MIVLPLNPPSEINVKLLHDSAHLLTKALGSLQSAQAAAVENEILEKRYVLYCPCFSVKPLPSKPLNHPVSF